MIIFYPPPSKEHLKRERFKARCLKSSRWWQQKLKSGICYYCHKTFSPDHLTMEHKVPIAKGGVSSKSNIVVACHDCNTAKGTKTSVDLVVDHFKNSELNNQSS